MRYLLDSNVFIQAKNSYYGMKICPGFWEWLLHSHNNQDIASIELVQEELKKGNDELAVWVKNNSHFFDPLDDEPTLTASREIIEHVMNLPHALPGAKEEFLSGADPWLIAKALATDTTLVTREKLDLQSKKKIFIPNICEHFNVPYIDTFELLHTLEAQFVLEKKFGVQL